MGLPVTASANPERHVYQLVCDCLQRRRSALLSMGTCQWRFPDTCICACTCARTSLRPDTHRHTHTHTISLPLPLPLSRTPAHLRNGECASSHKLGHQLHGSFLRHGMSQLVLIPSRCHDCVPGRQLVPEPDEEVCAIVQHCKGACACVWQGELQLRCMQPAGLKLMDRYESYYDSSLVGLPKGASASTSECARARMFSHEADVRTRTRTDIDIHVSAWRSQVSMLHPHTNLSTTPQSDSHMQAHMHMHRHARTHPPGGATARSVGGASSKAPVRALCTCKRGASMASDTSTGAPVNVVCKAARSSGCQEAMPSMGPFCRWYRACAPIEHTQ